MDPGGSVEKWRGEPCCFPRLARNQVTSPITGFSPDFPEIVGYRKSLETES